MSPRVLNPGDPGADLSPARRRRDLDEVQAPVDVVVIGGGITGAGVALDAASRGLTVVLIEAVDLAFGTSRWSSKLVHGGLRYLATGDVATAWESAVERGYLMRTIAPFLIRPMAQVVPIMDDTPTSTALLTRLGFAAGDALRAGSRTRRVMLPTARTLPASKVRHLIPAIDVARLRGGLLSWDGSLEDDARLTIAVARTAAAYGAHVLTGMRVLQADATGVVAQATATEERLNIRARHVINATGVWSAAFDTDITITPSRGTHVVLRASRLEHPRAAMTTPVPNMRGRYCFLLPRPDSLVIAGITDVAQTGPICEVPDVPPEDVAWILEQVSRDLQQPLTTDDVVGAFTGLRPLVHPTESPSAGPTSDVSRQHLVAQGPNGVWTVTGGKLTTYRRMAEDVVNRITNVPCGTKNIALIGAGGLTQAQGLPARLIRRYGAEAPRVAALAHDEPQLLDPVAPGVPALGVEFAFGVLSEGARTTADLIERRCRISMVEADVEKALPAAIAAVERWCD